jgi:hypothetical protein
LRKRKIKKDCFSIKKGGRRLREKREKKYHEKREKYHDKKIQGNYVG